MNGLHHRLLGCILLLTITTSSRAQFVWTITHDYKDDSTTNYTPLLLGCAGNHCTAVVNAAGAGRGFTFLRSDDGGRSWNEQWRLPDPGMPYNGFRFVYAMQQIDSLNAVIVGDSAHIFRTFNGGMTWEKQVPPASYAVASFWGVHFHDPLNGIIGAPDRPITTSDGGRHWVLGPVVGTVGDQNCHCFGPGSFAILCQLTRKIYRTHDNWVTIDSTPAISDTSIHHPSLPHCNWTDGDTIIAYGFDIDNSMSASSLIVRTTDGGKSWERSSIPQRIKDQTGSVVSMTSITDDTLYAGAPYPGNILFSSDQGRTWQFDTVAIGAEPTQVALGIARPSPGVVLACMPFTPSLNAPGVIVRGVISMADVAVINPPKGVTSVFPNPARESVTINFTMDPHPVYIIDVLGREMLRLPAPAKQPFTISTSPLPAGTYFVTHGIERARFVKE